jgi:hypothetical protein
MMSSNDDDFVILFLLFSSEIPAIASLLYTAKSKQLLPLSNIHRRDPHIPRFALLHPGASPFRTLYMSGDVQSLISFTGLDYWPCDYLLQKFTLLYLRYSPYSISGKIVV